MSQNKYLVISKISTTTCIYTTYR